MGNIIDGKALSAAVKEEVKAQVPELEARYGRKPCLVVIIVGENPASQVYVRNKVRAAEYVGIDSLKVELPADTPEEALLERIAALNADPAVDGILVQLPLPAHLDEQAALAKILPEKDVDGFHLINAGHLMTGTEGVIPCTPKGALYMIRSAGIDLNGKEAVVIGRSNIVGKPMAMLLLRENCTVTVCHSRTRNLAEHTRRADILVAAVGKAGFVTADMVKPGAIVIDVGINRVDGKVCGDVDFESIRDVAEAATPVPGGVGGATTAILAEHLVKAAKTCFSENYCVK